jgi:hypothetical protein
LDIGKSINTITLIIRIMDKDHMTISVDIAKTFDKIQNSTSLPNKSPEETRIEGTDLDIINAIHNKPVVDILVNRKK